jgi:phosphoglycerate dehydrogenase-like enzyme
METHLMKVMVPTTLDTFDMLDDAAHVVWYDPAAPIAAEHQDAEVVVAWGNPLARLREIAAMPRLRWVASLAAGTEPLLAAGFPAHVVLTSGRGLHRLPVAEHALALVLAAARRLHELRDAQRERSWAGHLGGIQKIVEVGSFRTLRDARAVVLGYGAIGRQIATYLRMLGAAVTGVATHARADSQGPVLGIDRLDEVLPECDVLVMVLPATPDTDRLIDARRLSLLPQHAWIVNVGRGSPLDEVALADALRANALGGAALDVFVEEPLPAPSPLWTLPNVIVSPHAAGGRPLGVPAFIADNLARLRAGEPLENVLERPALA